LLQSLKHKTMDYNETQGVVSLTEMSDQPDKEEKSKDEDKD